jgi:two-component system sensor histidine kinase KdpD
MMHTERASGYVTTRFGDSKAHGSSSSSALLTRLSPYRGYVWGLVASVVSGAISWLVMPYAEQADLVMIHLVGVVIIAIQFSVGVSIFTGIVSILVFDFFFIPPAFIVVLPDGKSILTFAVMILVAGVISTLQERVRRGEMTARKNEAKTATLYALSGDLVEVHQVPPLLALAARHLERSLPGRVRAFQCSADGELQTDDRDSLSAAERALGARAWALRELVIDEDVPGLNAWQPLVGSHRMVGLLGLSSGRDLGEDADQRLLLGACAGQIGIAVERTMLATAVQRIQVEAESERLRSSLLSAVSHDLRTPLAAILVAGTTLADNYALLHETQGRELLSTIVGESERLNDLLHNLLSITRLESGALELTYSNEALDDLVGSVLSRLHPRLEGRDVKVEVSEDLPEVNVDPVLVHQVLVNLIENALRYTPSGSALYVRARELSTSVAVQVADEGPGIEESERQRVFEKFYRGPQARKSDGGVGLGLTICRAVVRAHGGHISIHERPGGGTVVEFTLPKAARKVAPRESV